jgi:predicted Ser/Thr protein kinase
MTGQTLSHYQIQEKLGEGGMGVVYKALDTHLNRPVALKLLPADKVSNPERRKRFVQEARAASALNHPHIVTIYDIASDDGHDFIAMEFVQGKTLDHLLHRKGLQLADTLKYSIQIADALAKAHSAGIVHRDLKPSNVMVTEDGRVKVLDFGLAKLVEPDQPDADASTRTLQEGAPKTDEGAIVGTVAYMSPEQAEGKKLDGRSDIFSFGSVLYEMSTGQRAFQGETKLSTLSAILREEPKPASQLAQMVPRDLEKVIQRCLRKDPERRSQSMKDVKIALEELKEESDSGELEVTEVRRVHAPIRLWGLGALILVAVTAVGIAAWLWLNRSDPTQEPAQLTAVPLTTYRGFEGFPSFSPDETQVAFSWSKEDKKCHIYIKQVGVEPPFQLTNTGLHDFGPAWSPDGRFIAFIRIVEPKKAAVLLIPQRGGSERQLASWDFSKFKDSNDAPHVAWTPDSQWVAFPYTEGDQERPALLLMSVNTA